MKSFVCALLILGLATGLQAAAVEQVVEELQSDPNSLQTDVSEMELNTNEDCHQPKETGRCFALFYRFAYDVEKRECVEFIYGGCAGNSNNFESKEECEKKCMRKPEESVDSTTAAVPEKEEESGTSNTSIIADAVTEQSVSS